MQWSGKNITGSQESDDEWSLEAESIWTFHEDIIGRLALPFEFLKNRVFRGEIMSVHYIPKGHHTVAPYFIVSNVHNLIDFLTSAFDAEVLSKMEIPGRGIVHCEIKIGDSIFMAGQREQVMKLSTHLYLRDVDEAYKRAIRAGGKSLGEPTNHPYGDRGAGVEDPQGNIWWISTHIEDVSEAEIIRRMSKR